MQSSVNNVYTATKTNQHCHQNPSKTECIMKQIDIENINSKVLSWRYTMCTECVIICEGKTLCDLFISSKYCQEKNHAISKRSSILKGYGNLKAAVEYINATRKTHTREFYEANYYAQNAIQISNHFNDNLNSCIKILAINMLKKISLGEYKDQSLSYFTLSELIILSNRNGYVKNIKKKTTQNQTFKHCLSESGLL